MSGKGAWLGVCAAGAFGASSNTLISDLLLCFAFFPLKMLTRVSMAPAFRGRQLGVLERRGVCLPRGAGCRCPGLEQASCGSTQAPSALHPCQSSSHVAPLLAHPVLALSSCLAGLDLNLLACCEAFPGSAPCPCPPHLSPYPALCLSCSRSERAGR